jgi:outer membrane protein TolC
MRFISSRAVPRHWRAACSLVLTVAAAAVHAADPRPLGFNEALAIAEQRSTRLAAQSATVSAATEQVGRATELPDPKLRFGVDNLPVSGSDAYSLTRDFMTMKRIGFLQDFPNGDKLKARGERAAREQALESASLEAQRAALRQDIAVTWLELHYARRAHEAIEQLARQHRLESETIAGAISGGRVTLAGAVAQRSALESARDRVLEQQRVVARAAAALAALVGNAAQRPLGAPPDTTKLAHSPAALIGELQAHPVQRVFEEREAVAATEVALATSAGRPDWGVEVSYGQRSPNFSNMLTVMVSIDLPIDKSRRQNRDVASKLNLLERARSEREEARRMHEAEVRATVSDWEIAGERARRFDAVLLPLARERVELALAAYRGGRGDLTAVLEARRAQTETQLNSLGAELERARAWARLNHLVLHEVKP